MSNAASLGIFEGAQEALLGKTLPISNKYARYLSPEMTARYYAGLERFYEEQEAREALDGAPEGQEEKTVPSEESEQFKAERHMLGYLRALAEETETERRLLAELNQGHWSAMSARQLAYCRGAIESLEYHAYELYQKNPSMDWVAPETFADKPRVIGWEQKLSESIKMAYARRPSFLRESKPVVESVEKSTLNDKAIWLYVEGPDYLRKIWGRVHKKAEKKKPEPIKRVDPVLTKSATPIVEKPEEKTVQKTQSKQVVAKVVSWAKKNAPSLLTGAAAGAAVRVGTQFGLAQLLVTVPGAAAAVAASPVAVAVVSAVAIGAVAGGVAKLVTTRFFGSEKDKKKGWVKNFAQGALWGAVGGGIGYGIASFFVGDGVVSPVGAGTDAAAQPVAAVAPSADAVTQSLAPSDAVAQSLAPADAVVQAAAPAVDPAAVGLADIKDVLSAEQMSSLPEQMQKGMQASSPQKLMHGIKEAAFWLAQHHDKAGAAHLLERAADMANQAGLQGHVVQQINADAAFYEAHGIGMPKNIEAAVTHARAAGHAVHNFGGRLLAALNR